MARSQRGVSALPRRSCSHTAPAAQHVLGRDMAAGDVRQRLRRRRTVSSERGDVEAMFKRSINYLHTSYHLPSTHHTLPLSTRLLSTPCSVSASLTHMPASQHPHLTFYGAIAVRSRVHASMHASRGANAERRRKPSPPGPKPAPGIVTTCASSKIFENISHEDLPLRSTKT